MLFSCHSIFLDFRNIFMKTIKIALIGYGRMGKLIEKMALTRGHEIVAKLDNERDWRDQLDQFVKADVAIEFSLPDKVVDNIHKCFDANIPVVVGTTGWYHHLNEVISWCDEQKQAIFYASNFSVGMNLMFMLTKEMSQLAAKYGFRMRLSEKHHQHKVDKPSGTALEIARLVKEHHPLIKGYVLEETPNQMLLPIEAVREGEVNGLHCLELFSSDEKLSLTHEALNRNGFAQGALMAAEFLVGKKGVFTMQDILQTDEE